MPQEERELTFHVAITGPTSLREYSVRVRLPEGALVRDVAEHAINVMGAAAEMGFALLDAAFSRRDHRL